jgi:hypothetical protein
MKYHCTVCGRLKGSTEGWRVAVRNSRFAARKNFATELSRTSSLPALSCALVMIQVGSSLMLLIIAGLYWAETWPQTPRDTRAAKVSRDSVPIT